MADLTVKQFNRYPPLGVVLSDGGGAINLSTASQVLLVMKGTAASTTPVTITGVMTIASAPGGYCTYAWATNDLSAVDTYQTEFAVFWAGNGLETIPSGGYNTIQVVGNLDGSIG